MSPSISGTITLDGSGVGSATVYAINTDGNTLVGSTTTNADGTYSIDVPSETTIHIAAEYDDGSNTYNGESQPFIPSGEPAILTVDDFEQYDGTTTLSDHYTDTGTWVSVVDEANVTPSAISGSQLLEMTEGWNAIYSTEGSGLANYFAKGETLKCYIYSEGSGSSLWNLTFGYDGSSGYKLNGQINYTNGDDLELTETGGATTLGSDGGTSGLSDGVWHRVEVTWKSTDEIVVEVYNNSTDNLRRSITATDSTHANDAGVGFGHDTGTAGYNFYVDHAHIVN